MSLTERIKHEASRLGFDAVGIARLPLDDTLSPAANSATVTEHSPLIARLYSSLLSWLDLGYHATMEWMSRSPERRSHPGIVLPGCRSIISVGLNYYTDAQANECDGHGRIARYAWGKDYHTVFKKRLKHLESFIQTAAPEAQTKWYVDTGPVMEKAWAQEAGLGWIGKHSNLVSSDYGSWLLLGEILTTLDLDADTPGTDLCGSCTLCLNACPTGAIVEPYVVNAETCISYLTIEYRGDEDNLSTELKTQMGNRIFGCDDCLDICPFNHNSVPTDEQNFHPTPMTLAPKLSELQMSTKEEFSARFQESPIRRAKHEGWTRNLSIAQKNSHKP
ncbi:MAG: epoxyqueuosine reductase [Nitrospirales bacterium]|nr:MAG: epoxyqueuosine reductase [Nitrospirales bacterium]